MARCESSSTSRIPVDDVDRAGKFYERAFGWQILTNGPPGYALCRTGEPRARHRRRPARARTEPDAVPLTMEVPAMIEALTAVAEAGGVLAQAPTTIPGVGRLAVVLDTEGNRIRIARARVAIGHAALGGRGKNALVRRTYAA